MKTPQMPSDTLAKYLSFPHEIWLKREDKHHYGSHKGRSIPLMISTHHKDGHNSFVISSSGNAALAAILSVQTHNKNKSNDPITLKVFIGQHVNIQKEKLLQEKINGDERITVDKTLNPKQDAFQYSQKNNAQLLRQSTDDLALVGYVELAKELAKIENLKAIFIPTSTGTTALGLHLGFKQLGLEPQIHIVQTSACHPIASAVTNDIPTDEEHSLAGAIVDKVAARKESVVAAVKNSKGAGWIISNQEIEKAIKLAKDCANIEVSPNGALSIAGLFKALQNKHPIDGAIACLITGL